MKKYIMIAAVLISSVVMAQNIQPKLEAIGNLVKATYLYDNGQVQQEGFYENGKLHGTWVSFDMNGNKTATAEYDKGEKVGKWMFYNNLAVNEVVYADNRVASVKNSKKDNLVNID